MPSYKMNSIWTIQFKKKNNICEKRSFLGYDFFYFDKLFSKTIISYEKKFFWKINTFLGRLLPKHYDRIEKKMKKSFFHMRNHYF